MAERLRGKKGIIIGGGASGLMAAITAAKKGASVTVLEHTARPGKKILSTGNGKCNLTNLYMDPSCYRSEQKGFEETAIEKFPPSAAVSFFRELGVLTMDRGGYVYPMSGQAQTVLDALLRGADRSGVRIVTECGIEKAERRNDRFAVATDQGTFTGDFLILACGSKAAKGTGSDGSGYELAKQFGHRIVKPLPALVQLRCEGKLLPTAAGVRTECLVTIRTEDGKPVAKDRGELQITDYGISGIPVFQVSRYAAKLLDRKKKTFASLDFLPDLDETEVRSLLKEQKSCLSEESAETFLGGIFNKKLASVLLKAANIRPEKTAGLLTREELDRLFLVIREFVIPVKETNPFEQAQICAGGVDTAEIDRETMQSKRVPGLYIIGELLDVDGICGGYNLQWAWSSGYAAGSHAAAGIVPEYRKNDRGQVKPLTFSGAEGKRSQGKQERKKHTYDPDQSAHTSRGARERGYKEKSGKASKNR